VTGEILIELKRHAPFTAFGAITGIALLLIIIFPLLFVPEINGKASRGLMTVNL